MVAHRVRVIVKGAYGLKAADSLWSQLILDLNHRKDAVRQTIGQIRELVTGFRAILSPCCT
jgi:hypothetical protein